MAIKVPVGYDTDGAQLDRDMTSDVSKAGGKAGAAGGKATSKAFSSSFRSGVKGVLAGLGLAAGLSEAKQFLGDSLAEAREAQKVGAATDLLVRKLGKSAGVTSKSIGSLSNSISKNVGLDDELIQTGANVLLGFKNIRNEIGKGNAVFDRATAAAVDLSATPLFKGNLTAASKALGKALADPEKGLTALGRVGIKFTDQQTKQIKAFAAQGDALSAQKIILKEVESRYKGTAASQATASDKARVAIDNLKEEIGNQLLPVVDDLARFAANKAVPAISDFIAEFKAGTGPAGEIRDVLEDVGDVLGDVAKIGKDVAGFFNGLPGPVKKAAVQLGIAYIAFRQVNGLMNAIGGTSAANLVRGLANAETRLDATGKAAYRLGVFARQAAGAAGLALFVSGVQDADRETATLKQTLGGAAAGFALGGPVGAAAGAIAGFTTAMINSDDATKQSKQELIDYGEVLDQISGKLKKGATDSIAADLQKNSPNVVKAAAALGFSPEQVAKYIQGNKQVQGELNRTLDLARQVPILIDIGNGGQIDAFSILQNALHGATSATDEGAEASKGLVDQFVRAQANALITAGKLSELRLKVDGVTGAVKPAREQLKLLGGAYVKPKVDTSSIFDATNALRDFRRLFGLPLNKTAHINIVPSGGSPIGGKALGGPVRAGVPYIVGEKRPEVFVPQQSGRIEPDVGRYMSSVPQAQAAPSSFTYAPTFTGPTTGRERMQEMEWTARYSTSARGANQFPLALMGGS